MNFIKSITSTIFFKNRTTNLTKLETTLLIATIQIRLHSNYTYPNITKLSFPGPQKFLT